MNSTGLRQAIFTRLNSYTPLTDLLGTGGVRSRTIQNTTPEDDGPFPYVTFSFPSAVPFDTKTSQGGDATVQVDVWSRGTDLERSAVQDAAYDALHLYDLPIAGADTVTVNVAGATEFMDSDNVTTHGVLSVVVIYDDI